LFLPHCLAKRTDQCKEACNSSWLQQQSRLLLSPSSGDRAVEGVADPQEVIVEESWEVHKKLVKDVMDVFLPLFVPESNRLSNSKPIKWCVINEKALPLMTAHFNSKVEAATQRLL
jgi:hypothetical protein